MGDVASPRFQVPGRRCEGQSQPRRSARHTVTPRHSSNHRPPRRTRRSVRPAVCRVSDRTMVRVVRPECFVQRPTDRELKRATMRKKTAPRARKQQQASSRDTSGLIAHDQNRRQSVATKSVLDNRSHRTPFGSAASPSRRGFFRFSCIPFRRKHAGRTCSTAATDC